MKLLLSRRVLCTPCNHAPCHFMQSHISTVHACLAVTYHMHFWQNDRDLLRATAVTPGWNGYRNKSQHRKLTLEKIILRLLLLCWFISKRHMGYITQKKDFCFKGFKRSIPHSLKTVSDTPRHTKREGRKEDGWWFIQAMRHLFFARILSYTPFEASFL